jgi:hypothetical protein
VTPLNLNTIANPQNGLLGAATAYTVPSVFPFGGSPVTPQAISVSDFNGDGLLDVAVANFDPFSGDRISIFAGRADGTFDSTPSVNLSMAGTTKLAKITAMTAFSLMGFSGGPKSLAVADASNDAVSVFKNLGGAGAFSFAPRVDLAAANGSNPVGIVAGQLDDNVNTDLALLQNLPDKNGNTEIEIFSGNGDGTFAKAFDAIIGPQIPGITFPTSIAIGNLTPNLTGEQDLVVGGLGGTLDLQNTTTPAETALGQYSFNLSLLGAPSISAVAIGNMDLLPGPDIVSVTTSGLVQVFSNDGSGHFTPVPSFAKMDGIAGTINKIGLGVLNNANMFSGLDDVILESTDDDSLTVMDNISTSVPKLASPIRYDLLGLPVDLGLGDFNLDGNLDVVGAAGVGFTLVHGAFLPRVSRFRTRGRWPSGTSTGTASRTWLSRTPPITRFRCFSGTLAAGILSVRTLSTVNLLPSLRPCSSQMAPSLGPTL